MRKLSFVFIGVLLSLCVEAVGGSFHPRSGEIEFTVYQTTAQHPLKEVKTTAFSPHKVGEIPFIDLDTLKVSHEYRGIGICMTDASCWILDQLGQEASGRLISEAFGRDGLNMSLLRLNCGSSDYATALYNYNDVRDDVRMKHFSVARDEDYMIPVLKRVISSRDDFFVFSSIWSCPGWMKDSGQMCGGSLLPAFANYWTAYLKAYASHGIHIDAITVQNEPLTDQKYANPATLISARQEMSLAGKLLPEAFRKAGLDTKIWIFDHNYKNYERVLTELSDPAVRANIDAVAWHPYKGDPSVMKEVRKAYPDVDFHLTERGMNLLDKATQNEKWCADLVFGALNNGCSSYCGWCLALDEDGQPVTGKFHCRGLFEVNLEEKSFRQTPLCTLFHQFSPYVKRGARIMKVDQPDPELTVITFRNPDGQYVIVVACDNLGGHRKRIQVKYKDQYLNMALPLYTWSYSTILIDRQ